MPFIQQAVARHLLTCLIAFLAPLASASTELDWDRIADKPPAGLIGLAEETRPALFYTKRPTGKNKAVPYLGFFISADGLALCPLEPLCWEELPEFRLQNGEKIGAPEVLAILEQEELALVRFTHQTKVFLELKEDLPPLGSWVVFGSPSFADGPVAGPVLAHRRATFHSKLKVRRKPLKHLSIAVTKRDTKGTGMVAGAPAIDEQGKVVAIHSFKVALPEQTFTFCLPVTGLKPRIDAAVKKGNRFKVPIPPEQQPFDPVIHCDEYRAGGLALNRNDYAVARKLADAAVAKFPDSEVARAWRLNIVGASHLEPEEFLRLIDEFNVPDDAPLWWQGIHHFRMGEALQAAGKPKEAIASYKKSDELYPDGMACASLVPYFKAYAYNEPKKAEFYARRATEYAPERIFFWQELQKILYAQAKWDEADKLQDRIYLLEELY